MKQEHREQYRKLGLKISYYRKLKGLTQEQLAEKLDKNLAFIGAVEAPNVDRTVSLDTLFDIAKVLDIPPYKLLKDD
ncbi:MAG: helix-turn-helix transcriptional regulator [Oscillospiraceae bacterium]|nr:helix-turn-helix transcriptional regulator [Oscillospiraceae bacterium]